MSSTTEDFSPGGVLVPRAKKTKSMRKRKTESGSDFQVRTNGQNLMQFQFDDNMLPAEEYSPLHTRQSDANLSTSVGT